MTSACTRDTAGALSARSAALASRPITWRSCVSKNAAGSSRNVSAYSSTRPGCRLRGGWLGLPRNSCMAPVGASTPASIGYETAMAKDELSVAALQLNSQADVAANLESCRRLVGRAARRGAELVLLPENFAFFGPEAGKRSVAESLANGPIAKALAEIAREFHVCVVGGGFPEQSSDPQRPHNTCWSSVPTARSSPPI